jgi:hypothetical protein
MWACSNAPWCFSRSLFISHCNLYSEGVEFVDEVQLCVLKFTQFNASKFLFLMHRIINCINLLIDHVETVRVLTEQLGIILRAMTYKTLSCFCTEINVQNDRQSRCLYCNCIVFILLDKICIGHSSTNCLNTHTHARACVSEWAIRLVTTMLYRKIYRLSNSINLLGYYLKRTWLDTVFQFSKTWC